MNRRSPHRLPLQRRTEDATDDIMGRSEVIILATVLLVGGSAFLLEGLGPDTVRIIAITACCLLILLMVAGMFFRARAKRRRALAEPEVPFTAEQDPHP
jgi:hypothetical protein